MTSRSSGCAGGCSRAWWSVGEQAWRHGHDYVFADQFAEVDAGQGLPGGLAEVVADAADHPVGAPQDDRRPGPPARARRCRQREGPGESMGVRWVHIPIVDERRTGEVKGIFDPIERAADVIADRPTSPSTSIATTA